MTYQGAQIIESPYLVDEIETERSKKRRTTKWWAKKKTRIVPSKTVLSISGSLICHPLVACELRKQMRMKVPQ